MSAQTSTKPNTKKLEDDFIKLMGEDVEVAMQLITGMFVGLTLEYTRRQGHDASKKITIEGGASRNITIHEAG